jgi:16S rRNA (cytosine1402-N4)-methyltransferase
VFAHVTVLMEEMLSALALQPGEKGVDCTLGGGGHTRRMCGAVGIRGKIWAFEKDELAIESAQISCRSELASGVLEIVGSSFGSIEEEIRLRGEVGKINAICADIGVSSPQFDLAERGFSFVNDGPLDMRMDRRQSQTAESLVNEMSQADLTRMFRTYGEEPKAHFVAQAIVQRRVTRPIRTTSDLAEIVAGAIHYKTKSRTHPATRVFQALRIAVNDELGELERMLRGAWNVLAPGGRLAVISFHSLEDRIVKSFFGDLAGKNTQIPRGLPLTAAQAEKMQQIEGEIIKPWPMEPTEQEVQLNPRARSAKLRVIRKIMH